MNPAKALVQVALKNSVEARSDDRILLMKCWEMQGLHLTEYQQQVFMKCMLAETITRQRREIQERGLYRASVKVQQQRMALAEQVKTKYEEV